MERDDAARARAMMIEDQLVENNEKNVKNTTLVELKSNSTAKGPYDRDSNPFE